MSTDVRALTFRKPFSASDRWWLAHPPAMSPVVQTVIEGTGTIDAGALREAVAAVAVACPDTAAHHTRRGWLSGGVLPRVRVVEGVLDGIAVADIAALHDPLPTPDGAWCEVLWCPGDPAALVFRASHAVMDLTGMALWIADVFRVLRGEPPIGAADTLTEDDVFDRFPAPAERPPAPKIEWESPFGQPKGTRRTAWVRRTVDGYHPGLAAKVLTALTTAYGLESGRFAVPLDLRRHVPDVWSTGNLSQVELFDVAAGEPWEALHERILTAMAEGREVSQRMDSGLLKLPQFALRMLIKMMEKSPPGKKRYASATVLAHVGRIEPAQVSTPSFEARTLYPVPLLTSMSPPTVDLAECGGRTELTLTWLAGPGVVERMAAVLDVVVEVLSPSVSRVWSGNETSRVVAAGTVVDRFRAVVERQPDGVAVRWQGGALSFAELDARSEVVAARLVGLGVGSGSVVGLLADRSVWAVVGLWGVLKAGGAYLPLDVQHPDGRLAGLLTDAGAQVCLVQGAYMGRAGAVVGSDCTAIVLDELPVDGVLPVPVTPSPDDLAYVIYTSGSTGAPKGVEIEHRALANYVDWATRMFDVDAHTNFALFTSLAFDLPNTALYLSTLAGGTLVLVPDEPNHLTLRHLLETSGANALKLTPSHLDLIGRLDVRPEGFRFLVVGGEPLRPAVAARAREQFGPDIRLFNHYGPTEATVGCVVNRYRPEHDDGATVPIGRPAANCTVRLLDGDRRPIAEGEVGEMYLGGAQLARGYRGRPDLTRERFTHLADGTRVYRTGDLARILPSGEIAFLGRADDQVKVDGHRVEPAEVAAALESHPAVRRAVVVARPAPHTAGKVLCAYVVAESGTTSDDLWSFVGERLPRYLLPAVLRLVDGFAQTTNGKIDLSALPEPFEESRPAAPAPADEVRDAVAQVWARTLSVDAGRLDGAADFHRLGGNSVLLLAMLAGVSKDVVGAERERVFMAELGRIIREPTLERVSDLARQARDGQPMATAGNTAS